MRTTVVAGNPKAASRTLDAGRHVAELITGDGAPSVIDVIELGPGVMGWGDSGVANAMALAQSSDLLIVASPTFKATYSGVLKLFLDQFATGDGLVGVTAVPLMLGAGPAHALAPELLLKPVLVELGAIVPVQGLYLNERAYAEPKATESWLARWKHVVLKSAAA